MNEIFRRLTLLMRFNKLLLMVVSLVVDAYMKVACIACDAIVASTMYEPPKRVLYCRILPSIMFIILLLSISLLLIINS